MSRVLFIENEQHVGPGLFATVLDECGVALDVIRPWRGEAVPTNPNRWDGIAIGGGAMSAYDGDKYPFIETEMRLVRTARDSATPVLGLCLGAQVMAAALGGSVYPNDAREIGFYEVRFTPEAESDPLWQGHTAPFTPAQWHGDTFSLPFGAVLLASSDLTQHQLFRVGDTHYGFQFHLEFDLPVFTEMVETDANSLSNYGVDPARLLRDAAESLPRVEPVGRAIFSRWTQQLSN